MTTKTKIIPSTKDRRSESMVVNYPIKRVSIVHIYELSLYKIAMHKTFEYIKEETLSLENIKDAPLQYCNDDFDLVINELRKTFIVGLYHLWFQELQAFLVFGGNKTNNKKKKVETTPAKDILNLFDTEDSLSEIIPILRKYAILTNAIKHGYGNSFDELYKNYKEFFYPHNEYTKTIDFEGEEYINERAKEPLVTESNVNELYDAVIGFWNNVPDNITIDFDELYPSKK